MAKNAILLQNSTKKATACRKKMYDFSKKDIENLFISRYICKNIKLFTRFSLLQKQIQTGGNFFEEKIIFITCLHVNVCIGTICMWWR